MICIEATCSKGTYWDEGSQSCKNCSAGCNECINGASCIVCNDTSVHCEGGYRYNYNITLQDKCEACTVKNCEQCSADAATCTKCFMGFTLNENSCNATLERETSPCSPGYYKDTEDDFKCKPCKAGCKRCTSATNCFQCMQGVKWSATANDVCSFDCDTACVDGQNGVFNCATPGTAQELALPAACALGYQYNGLSLKCERANQGEICNSTLAPVLN